MRSKADTAKVRIHALEDWVVVEEHEPAETLIMRNEPEGDSVPILARGQMLWGRVADAGLARDSALALATATIDDPGEHAQEIGLEVRADKTLIIDDSPGRLAARINNERRSAASEQRLGKIAVCHATAPYTCRGEGRLNSEAHTEQMWAEIATYGPDLVIITPTLETIALGGEVALRNKQEEPIERELGERARNLEAGILVMGRSVHAATRLLSMEYDHGEATLTYRGGGHSCQWTVARPILQWADSPRT